jgi:hypothetical protein
VSDQICRYSFLLPVVVEHVLLVPVIGVDGLSEAGVGAELDPPHHWAGVDGVLLELSEAVVARFGR